MKVRVDNTVDELTESDRQFDPAHRILVMLNNGTKFDISEDQGTGKLVVRTNRGVLAISPRAANVIYVREELS